MAAMTQVGSILGLLIAGRLVGSAHPQDLLCATIVAAVLIVFAGITVATVREVAQKSAPRLRFEELLRCFWVNPVRYPDFAWVWVTRALFTAGWWIVYPSLYPFLRDVVHAPAGPARATGGERGLRRVVRTTRFAGDVHGQVDEGHRVVLHAARGCP